MKLGYFNDDSVNKVKNMLTETASFSEIESLDFARCQRPDGSFYGTGGQCRKGKEAGAKEKVEPKSKSQVKSGGELQKASGADIAAAITPKMESAFKDMLYASQMDDLESIDGYVDKKYLPDRKTAEEILNEKDKYQELFDKAETKLQTLEEGYKLGVKISNSLNSDDFLNDPEKVVKEKVEPLFDKQKELLKKLGIDPAAENGYISPFVEKEFGGSFEKEYKRAKKELDKADKSLSKAEEMEKNLEDFYGNLGWRDRQHIYGRKRGSSDATAFDRLEKDSKVLATAIERNLKKSGKTIDSEEIKETIKQHISADNFYNGEYSNLTLKDIFEN